MVLPSSSDLDIAVDASEQTPTASVKVSWDKSGSFTGPYDTIINFSQIQISRSLTGDLPRQVAILSGEASAEVKIDLANGETLSEQQDAAWYYSRLNSSSPLSSYERLNMPVQVELGYRTASNPSETCRKLTGHTTDLDVNVSAGTASLTSLDNRTTLNTPVALPPVVANEGDNLRAPGLDGQWLIDYVLRRNGYYASPPPRAGCSGMATFHGSTYPEIGTLYQSHNNIFAVGNTPTTVPAFTQGKFAEALDADGQGYDDTTHPYSTWSIDLDQSNPVSTSPGAQIHWEMWAKLSKTSGVDSHGSPIVATIAVVNNPYGGGMSLLAYNGVIYCSYTRYDGAATEQIVAPALTNTTPQWTYLGVEFVWTTTGATVRLRINNTTYVSSSTTGYTDSLPAFDNMQTYLYFPLENMQISNVATNTWNDAFTPNAYLDPSNNQITAVVASTADDSWALLKEIASAELGSIHFDEYGVFYFWTGYHWATTASQVVTKTIDIADQIKTIGYSDGLDQVVNYIEAPTTTYTIGAPSDQLWIAPSSFVVVAGSSSTTIDVDLGKSATGIPPTIAAVYDPTQSWMEARPYPGGPVDWASVSGTVQILSATMIRITIVNSASTPRYLLASDQTPSLHIYGSPIISSNSSATIPTVQDDNSIAEFGLQKLTLPTNVWRQDPSSARGIAQALLSQISEPTPVITAVTIVGDPRVQLGDRHYIADGGAGIAGNYRVKNVTETHSSSGYTMNIDYVKSLDLLVWDVGDWNEGLWA